MKTNAHEVDFSDPKEAIIQLNDEKLIRPPPMVNPPSAPTNTLTTLLDEIFEIKKIRGYIKTQQTPVGIWVHIAQWYLNFQK